MKCTQDKIDKLGKLYKATCYSMNYGRLDEHAICEDLSLDEMAELLPFALMLASPTDKPMQYVIAGMRGLLENAVHTAAGA